MNLKNFELFYCTSYQAFLMGLYLIHCGKRIIFITQNKNIIKTCNDLNIKVIKLEQFSQKQIYLNSKRVKEYINQLCELGNGIPLHFTHTQFDTFCFLLINCYSKVGSLFFYNFEVEYDIVQSLVFEYGFIKQLFLRRMLKKIYGCECVIKTIDNRYLIGIERKNIEKYPVKIIDNKKTYYNQILEAIRYNQIELNKYDNLFLYQDFSSSAEIKSLSVIYNFLNKYDFAIKPHPRRPLVDIALRNMPSYPNYLPSELIFNNVARNVVAIYSSSLITASKFSQLKAISLIELVKWHSDNYKNIIKEELVTSSNNKIFFPRNFGELSDLL